MTKVNLSNTVIGIVAVATTAAIAYKAYGEELPHGKYYYNNHESAKQYQDQYDYYTLIQGSFVSKSNNLHYELKSWDEKQAQKRRAIKLLRGKYKGKLTPSDEFARKKSHEIELEA